MKGVWIIITAHHLDNGLTWKMLYSSVLMSSYPISFLCGDANSDDKISVGDVVYLINYVFSGGAEPEPFEAGNVNCDTRLSVSDAVYLINYIFLGGNAPCDCK